MFSQTGRCVRFLVAAAVLAMVSPAPAAPPRVLAEGKQPDDRRLGPPKDLDGYFPFEVPPTAEAWEKRREEVRRQTLLANGLWPMPSRPPVEAIVHGTVDGEGYTVSRVYFESTPGLFVTGSLFRPKGDRDVKRPAILCPHGHWANGRFYTNGPEGIQKEIASGAEKFEAGAKHPLQARCVQLARMGCIVFHYDMLGYADSVPLSFEVAHRFAKQRPELSSPEKWGMFSAQAELRCINVLGLQTWNSIRALDWIASLEDVDASRIGVTGASGGGTQTFILSAVDDRIAAAFPAVMVSTAMQGGCTCENASYLRVGTGNIELAGLTAPRPLGMTAANDWTRELEAKGLPELRRLYALLGVPDRVEGHYFPFEHNYNAVSRHVMYEFFNRHFQLGAATPIEEREFVPLTQEELTVWDARHPKPAMDEIAEVSLMRSLDRQGRDQILALDPTNGGKLAEFRCVVGQAWSVMIGRSLAETGDVEAIEPQFVETDGSYRLATGRVRNETHGEELPAYLLLPQGDCEKIAVWVHREGKAGLFGEDGSPLPAVRKLLEGGYGVLTADLIGQGEFTPDSKPVSQTRTVENPREFAGYTLGYNHPLFAQRVHDVLTLLKFARELGDGPEKVALIGFDEASAWCAAACVQSGGDVDRLAVGTGGCRFGAITDVRDPNLLPGAVKYGDLPALLALCAPTPMWVAGEGAEGPGVVRMAYKAAGRGDSLAAGRESNAEKLAEWLVSE